MPELLNIAGSSRVLLVLRHGKSDWDADYDQDFSRPLAPRGIKAARKMAAFIGQLGLEPDAVISSPARRALTTAEIVAAKLGLAEPQHEMAIYGAGSQRLIEVVGEIPVEARIAVLVGHNPGLESLVEELSGESYIVMKTCSLAVLESSGNSWADARRGGFRLRGVFHPRELPEPD